MAHFYKLQHFSACEGFARMCVHVYECTCMWLSRRPPVGVFLGSSLL